MLFQIIRQTAGYFVLTHTNRFGYILKGIFRHQIVLAFTQQQSDRRIVLFFFQNAIYCRQVEVQLTGIFRFEISGFQFDDYIAPQVQIIE